MTRNVSLIVACLYKGELTLSKKKADIQLFRLRVESLQYEEAVQLYILLVKLERSFLYSPAVNRWEIVCIILDKMEIIRCAHLWGKSNQFSLYAVQGIR
jgi:hypothetical protein